jgi:tRNA A37 threonylcarbamoyladenosine dehydratase
MSVLGVFCNQLLAFFEDMSETYPEEKDIAMAASALKLLKQVNPRLIHTVFMNAVDKELVENVLNENETYVIEKAKDILNSKYSEIAYAFWIFDKHWTTMTETNKRHVWDYFKTIVLLAQKVGDP